VRSSGGSTPGDLAWAHGNLTMKETELVSIKNHLARVAAVGAVGVVTMAGFVAPASASTGSMHVRAGAIAAAPNTNIQGSPAKWSPVKLSVKNFKTCTATSTSFTITNKTAKAQTIDKTKSGSPLGTVKAHQKVGVCMTGFKAGAKAHLFIKSSKAELTLAVT
jgi:hypothetical protein